MQKYERCHQREKNAFVSTSRHAVFIYTDNVFRSQTTLKHFKSTGYHLLVNFTRKAKTFTIDFKVKQNFKKVFLSKR